jgi:uncharacterized membrane protein
MHPHCKNNTFVLNIFYMNLLLALHSFLRWAIVILLLIVIFRNVVNKNKPFLNTDRALSLRLLIATHITFLIGLVQYFFGNKGFALVKQFGMKEVMKNSNLRFWVVEHITGMLIVVVLITIANVVSKKQMNDTAKHNKLFWLYLIAFIVVMASIPWPFRFNEIPWVRGL